MSTPDAQTLVERLRDIMGGLTDLWCGWTHGGGHILRDSSGRINWQCGKCGRWSSPVPAKEERGAIDAAMRDASNV